MSANLIILIATYNRSSLLLETIASLQKQTLTHWKCIVVDDHSTDDTSKVMHNVTENDIRFNYYLRANTYKKGPSGCRNMALEMAIAENAEYIHFFDDDDLMHPEKLSLQLKALENDPKASVSYCNFERFQSGVNYKEINNVKKEKSQTVAEDFLFTKIRLNIGSTLLKADLLKTERFDENLNYGEEKEFFLRIFFKYQPVSLHLNATLFYYRDHQQSLTGENNSRLLKRGSEIVIHEKLWDFLDKEKIVNKKSIAFLTRQFLLENHNKKYLVKVVKIVKSSSSYSSMERFKFNWIIQFHQFYIKFMYKLLILGR
ncbi:glycosyltransferase family A protein [Christiangramia sp. OXR-203]|uniref:glycosyltransferase family 2 protein n=1 Tax=Christiangramia sp. OXR-203 TaxID=3100176 RepID=UPI002AC9210E|nr:glycosyltransferase family A protein [Christiangramia sp. OXR-203]WPY97907.1 glycosyltransferase family A protein [Christiangramia sp. OXR-203]